jgi:hypothetical protein
LHPYGGERPDVPDAESFEERAMARIKRNVKGLLNQPVRIGFMTVPLWVLGAVFLGRKLMARRRRYA